MASGKHSPQTSLPKRRNIPKAQNHLDEQDDDDELDGVTAGLREVGITRKTPKDAAGDEPSSPLRLAKVALHQTYVTGLKKYHNSLVWIDTKVNRAMSQSQFSIKFLLSDVDDLGSTSHQEYVGFIQLLSVMGYAATYSNGDEDEKPKGQHVPKRPAFAPDTTIMLSWMPQKK
jgi:hypothetical protein